jgi:ABC-type bacteriocin/lantibiotic exporter with double-glycine peptidase domain
MEFFLTIVLTFVTIFLSLFFLSKRALLKCSIVLTVLSIFSLICNSFEPQLLQFVGSESFYGRVYEFLDVLLWLMLVGIIMTGCRNEYRDKQHLEIEHEVDSTAENSFANVKDRLSWDFEDEYVEFMDWSECSANYSKSS